MNIDEKIVQISSRAGDDTYFPALFALTSLGNIYELIDDEWVRIELPMEQEARLELEKHAPPPPKKGWFK